MFKKNIIIALILFYVNTYSQDIAFTQSFMVPETINPSFSGFNGSTKFGLLYKNQQWNGFDFNVNSEYMFFDDWFPDLNSGIGISFVSHQETFTKYSLNQILSFSRPKNIFMNKLIFTKINFDFNEINKYFLTLLIFILSLIILTSLLSISGIEFENSFKLSILTLMNTVNSSIYGLEEFDFNNIHFLTKYCLILFMIIGRIELLTILLLLKKFLFKS